MKHVQLAGRHTTIVAEGVKPFKRIANDDRVKKVTVGYTRRIGVKSNKHPPGTLVWNAWLEGGIRCLVHGSEGFTELHIYTDEPAVIIEEHGVVMEMERAFR